MSDLVDRISPTKESTACPCCGASPVQPFLYGLIHRNPYTWRTLWLPIGKARPCIAVICWDCKEIIGYD